jgi:UDP-N-acetylmuramoyl-tripeptide--D-alanyl-D-alanine ligase
MKKIAKNVVVKILGWQVRRLQAKNRFQTIGVVGSIGKTSTKFALARVIGETKTVRFQEGNYNDIVSVPLVFFGHELPALTNVLAWFKLFWSNEKQLRKTYPYDVVVVELGTDGPGQIAAFASYLHCDYAVVTAITPEHMEFFPSLDEVASEELSVSKFADYLLINGDLSAKNYQKDLDVPILTYGFAKTADYMMSSAKFLRTQATFEVTAGDWNITATIEAVSRAELYSATAAATMAHLLNVTL